MRLDGELVALAAHQRSCIGIWQARALGATSTEITRLRRGRLWRPVNDGALCLAAVDVDRDVITSANVLSAGAGAFLSHESGAAWRGHGGFPLLPNAVSQRRGRTHRNHGDGRLHDLVEAPPRWITAYRGVSVARPELIAYQLCGNVRPERAERVLDWFWSQGLLTIASAKQCLADLAERGRNGTVVFRELLAPRSDAQHPFGSGLEQGRHIDVSPLLEKPLGQNGWRTRKDSNCHRSSGAGRGMP